MNRMLKVDGKVCRLTVVSMLTAIVCWVKQKKRLLFEYKTFIMNSTKIFSYHPNEKNNISNSNTNTTVYIYASVKK